MPVQKKKKKKKEEEEDKKAHGSAFQISQFQVPGVKTDGAGQACVRYPDRKANRKRREGEATAASESSSGAV